MNTRLLYPISFVTGVACGLVSNVGFFRGSWIDLLLWGIVGFALGLFVDGARQTVGAGAIYGVSLAVAFLVSVFGGTPDKIPGYALLTAILSLAAGLGAIADVFVASRVKRMISRR